MTPRLVAELVVEAVAIVSFVLMVAFWASMVAS